MILYPTDDELEILDDIIVKEYYCSDKYKNIDIGDLVLLIYAREFTRSLWRYFIGYKPLKINETVLG
jgi:hypothetical protein